MNLSAFLTFFTTFACKFTSSIHMTRKKKKPQKSKSFLEALGTRNIFQKNETLNFVIGIVLILLALVITIAFISYFSTGEADQSLVTDLRPGEIENSTRSFQNYCGSLGAIVSYFFISRCFGLAAFTIPVFLVVCGLKLMSAYKVNLWKWFFSLAIITIWCSVTFAKFLTPIFGDRIFNPGGDHGAYISQWIENIIGAPGLIALLLIVALAFLAFVSSETINIVRKLLNPLGYLKKIPFVITNNNSKESKTEVATSSTMEVTDNAYDDYINNNEDEDNKNDLDSEDEEQGDDTDMIINVAEGEEVADGKTVEQVDLNTPINHKEPFTRYKYPTLDLLKTYEDDGKPYIDREEQESNKNRIIRVLNSFGVQISEIRATIGPTITLYEVTPAPGVKISRIKNLEDDIALSLSAMGIRIIAPIPGKGTIGIEVPNAKANVVSMQSILNSKKFQETRFELPVALGKTIMNEVYMVDLAKIPHLLVAGATGQGKSVGMNAIITSLLYKKHPNELKFVLIDPKKVEFSVYSSIADHFMASLEENEDEPIITDTSKVVKTLNGLCVLMDNRYDLLKKAGARNIKEYNEKYLSRRLKPTDGHDFMPYIVVIIDEFADLIITAGKEVETPITRIAQLARAVGIHMVIATQRPSTKVITGGIKANFPGRIAFKTAQRIDSSIILDRTGANQLIGRGDMLCLIGNEPERVQCAFVDTPEVEKINEYISNQPGPRKPYEIPEPTIEESAGGGGSFDANTQIDPLFNDAARIIVSSQQGSTSMIQRRFSIGYNRAGRLMDQLEQAGIVGVTQGSKPREVLIQDVNTLEQLLASLNK